MGEDATEYIVLALSGVSFLNLSFKYVRILCDKVWGRRATPDITLGTAIRGLMRLTLSLPFSNFFVAFELATESFDTNFAKNYGLKENSQSSVVLSFIFE